MPVIAQLHDSQVFAQALLGRVSFAPEEVNRLSSNICIYDSQVFPQIRGLATWISAAKKRPQKGLFLLTDSWLDSLS